MPRSERQSTKQKCAKSAWPNAVRNAPMNRLKFVNKDWLKEGRKEKPNPLHFLELSGGKRHDRTYRKNRIHLVITFIEKICWIGGTCNDADLILWDQMTPWDGPTEWS